MKKKILILFLLSLFAWLSDTNNPEVRAQAIPSCYEHSACPVIDPQGQSWCVREGSGSPCFNTACDCS